MKLKTLFLETRPHFLILTPACFMVGVASAIHDGVFNPIHATLTLVGLILAHVSVNVLNDYFDYKKGTDLITVRTPFSGGSGFLTKGLVKPREALLLGLTSLIVGLLIGVYFIINYPILLVIVGVASAIIVLYTPVLTRIYVTELFPGLSFGPLMVVGTYITQLPANSVVVKVTPIAASIPVGLLVSNLLFLNEFPDYEADLKTGRRHGVILLGRSRASRVYVLVLALVYASIILFVMLKALPLLSLITLATIPISIKASKIVLKNYDRLNELVKGMALNVLTIIITPILLAVSLILSTLL